MNNHMDNIKYTNKPVHHWFLNEEAYNPGPPGGPMPNKDSNTTYQNKMSVTNKSIPSNILVLLGSFKPRGTDQHDYLDCWVLLA